MNTLEKMATKIAKKRTDQSEKLIEEVKLLLAGDAQEERHALASVGLDFNLSRIEKRNGDLILRKNAGDFLGKKIIHQNELRTLCKDFRLVMRPARMYVGTIPPDLGTELKNFAKEKNVPLVGVSHSNFFVVAPPKMFSDYSPFSDIWTRENNQRKAEIEERIRIKNEDPMLVYRLDNSKEHFAIIKSWGEDFTFVRRIYAFLVKKSTTMWINFLTHAALLVAEFCLGFKIISVAYQMSHIAKTGTWAEIWPMPVAVIVCLLIIIFTATWIWDIDNMKLRQRIMAAFYGKPWFIDNGNNTYS